MNRLFDRLNAPNPRAILAAALVAASASMSAAAAKPGSPPGDLENAARNGVANSCLNTATSSTDFQSYTCGCTVYTVPSGKILVLESASGFVGTAGSPVIADVHALGDNGVIVIPVVPSAALQDYAFFVPAKAYFTEGKQVVIESSVQPKTAGETCLLNGRVTGYLVDEH